MNASATASKATATAKKAKKQAPESLETAVVVTGAKHGRGDRDENEEEDEPPKKSAKQTDGNKAKGLLDKKSSKESTPIFAGRFNVFSWAVARAPLQMDYTSDGLETYPEVIFKKLTANDATDKSVGRIAVLSLPERRATDEEKDGSDSDCEFDCYAVGRFNGTNSKDREGDGDDEDEDKDKDEEGNDEGDDEDDEASEEVDYKRCPYDLNLVDIDLVKGLKFDDTEFELFPEHIGFGGPALKDEKESIGISGTLVMREEACGIENADGLFKMRRLWKGQDGSELFEGYLSFDIDFNMLLKHRYYMGQRKRHSGADKQHKVHFWATRKGISG
ncbi:hypothetical protein D9758_001636 [Tetrapyrgos nigripes]|uniref:Uncharacterized protein n=1 Tax=Tetrapyrgos nigripes TaxID=182062 RepID=A0A8H5GXZ3_9AGAR|nr:hypothetical protein D9758_001636 [Tetrapyrgos nigripes]